MENVEKKAKIFSVCAFDNYKVDYLCKYSCKNEDVDFIDRELKESYAIDGGKLIDSLAKLIFDRECISFTISENQIIIEHFSPNTGESSVYDFKIKELKK